MRKKTKNRLFSKKARYIAIGTCLVLFTSLASFTLYRHYHKKPLTGKTADGQPVNLSPPTKEEKNQNDTYKDAIVNDGKPPTNTGTGTTGKKSSAVFITSASASGVNAYVTGVFEDGGTCTATATQGSQVITKTSTGFQNVSYTQCAPISWDTALTSGTWNVTVSYTSSTTSSSQSTIVEV